MQIEQAHTEQIQLDITYSKPNQKNIFQNEDNQDDEYNTLLKNSFKASSGIFNIRIFLDKIF